MKYRFSDEKIDELIRLGLLEGEYILDELRFGYVVTEEGKKKTQ